MILVSVIKKEHKIAWNFFETISPECHLESTVKFPKLSKIFTWVHIITIINCHQFPCCKHQINIQLYKNVNIYQKNIMAVVIEAKFL